MKALRSPLAVRITPPPLSISLLCRRAYDGWLMCCFALWPMMMRRRRKIPTSGRTPLRSSLRCAAPPRERRATRSNARAHAPAARGAAVRSASKRENTRRCAAARDRTRPFLTISQVSWRTAFSTTSLRGARGGGFAVIVVLTRLRRVEHGVESEASALNGVQCSSASELPDVRRRVVVSMLRGVCCASA